MIIVDPNDSSLKTPTNIAYNGQTVIIRYDIVLNNKGCIYLTLYSGFNTSSGFNLSSFLSIKNFYLANVPPNFPTIYKTNYQIIKY